jgi:hypothetical protein
VVPGAIAGVSTVRMRSALGVPMITDDDPVLSAGVGSEVGDVAFAVPPVTVLGSAA